MMRLFVLLAAMGLVALALCVASFGLKKAVHQLKPCLGGRPCMRCVMTLCRMGAAMLTRSGGMSGFYPLSCPYRPLGGPRHSPTALDHHNGSKLRLLRFLRSNLELSTNTRI